MTHYDAAQLGAYLLDRALVAGVEELEAHLAECVTCAAELASIEQLDAALRDPATWEELGGAEARSGALAEALALQERIAREDHEAERMLEHYLKSPLRFRGADLAGQRRFRTAGVVRVLCAAAHGMHEKRPRFSRDVAATAVTIAKELPEEEPQRRTCVGMALREWSIALRYLGAFSEALEALDEAERMIGGTAGAEDFDRALVWIARATIYMKSGHLEDALRYAKESAPIFVAYGDTERAAAAAMVQGAALMFAGDAEQGARSFERVVETARAGGDTALLVRGLHNAAVAYASLADFERAANYFAEALALYDQFDVPTEAARARWGLASTLSARGELSLAIAALDASRRELAGFGLTNDAALATLDWAEARLAAGMPAGVADACGAIVMVFDSQGMERNARLALAYLQEALAAGTATPSMIRHVRNYIGDLPIRPELSFVPLA